MTAREGKIVKKALDRGLKDLERAFGDAISVHKNSAQAGKVGSAPAPIFIECRQNLDHVGEIGNTYEYDWCGNRTTCPAQNALYTAAKRFVRSNPKHLVEAQVTRDKLNGFFQSTHANGALEFKASFKNGKIDGEAAWTSSDGTKFMRATFKAGKKVGSWRFENL